MHDQNLKPNDNYKKIFKAQLIKDFSMAHKINKLLKQDTDDQKYLVIAGKGHMQYCCGVPERVFEEFPHLKDQCSLVVANESDHMIDITKDEQSIVQGIKDVFGEEGTNPADYLYIY